MKSRALFWIGATALAILGIAIGTGVAADAERLRDEGEFFRLASARHTALQSVLDAQMQRLRATADRLATNLATTTTWPERQRKAEAILSDAAATENGALSRLIFAPRISRDAVAELALAFRDDRADGGAGDAGVEDDAESSVASRGRGGFRVREPISHTGKEWADAAEREEYFPVIAVYPPTKAPRWIGRDLAAALPESVPPSLPIGAPSIRVGTWWPTKSTLGTVTIAWPVLNADGERAGVLIAQWSVARLAVEAGLAEGAIAYCLDDVSVSSSAVRIYSVPESTRATAGRAVIESRLAVGDARWLLTQWPTGRLADASIMMGWAWIAALVGLLIVAMTATTLLARRFSRPPPSEAESDSASDSESAAREGRIGQALETVTARLTALSADHAATQRALASAELALASAERELAKRRAESQTPPPQTAVPDSDSTFESPSLLAFWTTDDNLTLTTLMGLGIARGNLDAKRFLGKPFAELLEFYDGEERATALAAHERALTGEPARYHYNFRGRLFEVHVEPKRDAKGIIVGCIGASVEVTELKRAQEAVRGHQRMVERIADAIPDIIYIFDLDTLAVIYVNSRLVDTLGYDLSGISGDRAKIHSLLHPNDVSLAVQTMASVREMADGDVAECDLRVRDANGAYRWLSLRTGVFSRDEMGRPTQAIGTALDITERKQTEEALKESQRALETLIENLPGLVYRCRNDRDWSTEFVSEGARELIGYPPEKLRSGEITFGSHVNHPDDREFVWQAVQTAIENREPFRINYRMITATGNEIWVYEQGRGIYADDGTLLALEGVIIDITERYRAEEALRDSEQRYRQMFETNRAVKLLIDPETGQIVDANQAACEFYGYDRNDIRELHISQINTLPREHVAARMAEARAETRRRFEFKHRLKSGEIRDVEVFSGPVKVLGRALLFSIITDITDRKRAESALRENEARLRLIVEQIPAVLWTTDRELHFTSSSGQALQSIGLLPNQAVGMPMSEFFRTKDPAFLPISCTQKALLGHSSSFEVEWAQRMFQAHIEPLRDPNGAIIGTLGVALDITDRKRSEAARALLAAAVEHAAEIIVIADRTGTIKYANPAASRIGGFRIDELVGTDFRDWLGTTTSKETPTEIWSAILAGQVWSGRATSIKKDGTPYETEATISPVRNSADEIEHVVMVKRDVTQVIALEAQIRQLQKMEAIGTLAGGVAHDFNNLLTGILGYAGLLKQTDGGSPEVREAAEVIETAARRAADLTGQLLGFARMGKHQNIAVDLHGMIREVIELLRRTIDPSIKLDHQLRAESATIMGDPTQIHQVLLNLTLNARDSMEISGGTLRIATATVDANEDFCRLHTGLVPGTYLVLSVSDTGHGVPVDLRERIFEPFFTTKPHGKGTGMGLAMVYGIVKNHHGVVELDSDIDRGSTFRVYLPLVLTAAEKSRPALPVRAAKTGTILVVDDETVVRNVAERMLQSLGFRVMTASDGGEAIAVYREHWPIIDLAIIDMVMPTVGGAECFRELKRINPRLRAVISTGFGPGGVAQELFSEGVVGFVQKPYQLHQLSEVVTTAMRDEE